MAPPARVLAVPAVGRTTPVSVRAEMPFDGESIPITGTGAGG